MKRLTRALVAGLVLASFVPALAYVLPTEGIIDKFHARRSSLKGTGVVVKGHLTLVDKLGVRAIVPASHAIRYDIGCRMTIDPGGGSELADQFVVGGRRTGRPSLDAGLESVVTPESLGCTLWRAHNNAGKDLWDYVRRFEMNVGLTSFGRFEGTTSYIIGATSWDRGPPQIWMEETFFLPTRVIVPGKDGPVDLRMSGFRDPATGELHPQELQLFVDGKLRLKFVAEEVDPDGALDTALFK